MATVIAPFDRFAGLRQGALNFVMGRIQQQKAQQAAQQLQGLGLPGGLTSPVAQQFAGQQALGQQDILGRIAAAQARPSEFKLIKQLIDDPGSPTKFSVVQRNQQGNIIGQRTATPKEVRQGVVADPQTGLSAKDKTDFAIAQSNAFAARPVIKNFRIVESMERNLQIALKKSLSDATLSKGPSDEVLVTALKKMIEPDSVVRESEFARTPEGISLINKLRASVEKVFKGGVGITNQDRQAIGNLANQIFEGMKVSFNTVFDEFSFRADKLGLDKSVVFGGVKRFDVASGQGEGLTPTEQTRLAELERLEAQ
ncbi:hypothetical protein LCGC14_2507990 [marine sediment metagenome]|uniref:Uncharacterized protein n=1 Tax=marine sediment metagenome TaxID=412755 RepID=A0A0F9B023_9ZZZZ